MKNKIVKSLLSVICMLTMGFLFVSQKTTAKTIDPPIVITPGNCQGASGHCLTYKKVIYYGRLIIK